MTIEQIEIRGFRSVRNLRLIAPHTAVNHIAWEQREGETRIRGEALL